MQRQTQTYPVPIPVELGYRKVFVKVGIAPPPRTAFHRHVIYICTSACHDKNLTEGPPLGHHDVVVPSSTYHAENKQTSQVLERQNSEATIELVECEAVDSIPRTCHPEPFGRQVMRGKGRAESSRPYCVMRCLSRTIPRLPRTCHHPWRQVIREALCAGHGRKPICDKFCFERITGMQSVQCVYHRQRAARCPNQSAPAQKQGTALLSSLRENVVLRQPHARWLQEV